MAENEKMSVIDMILDEENNENVVLYDDNNKAVEFEQVALIPLDEELYVILKPVDKIEDIADDEALVFQIIEESEDEASIVICTDFDVVDKVFEEYYALLKEEGLLKD